MDEQVIWVLAHPKICHLTEADIGVSPRSRKSPSADLDKDDPGDEVGLRFQYQYCYAAINATRLVTNKDEVSAIICENHEDFLIERPSGGVIGVQVKTRKLSRPAFQANDREVQTALERFCKLEAKFPEEFECFEFVTNHSFWQIKDNAQNLPWILSELRNRGNVSHLRGDNPMRKLVDCLSEKLDLEIEIVTAALLKTKILGREDTINSIFKDLREAVFECPELAQEPYAVGIRIADDLQKLAADASTKNLDGPVSDRYAAGANISDAIQDQLMAGKRITSDDVMGIVDRHVKTAQTFETLNIVGLVPPDQLPHGLERMVKKMARGGVQRSRIQGMQDLVYSIQALYMRWVNKDGAEVAKGRYEDLLARVRLDCIEASVEVEDLGDPYGSKMYEALSARISKKAEAEQASLYGCKPEHLLGAAGVLTENCKTWWSTEFDPEDAS